MKPRGTAGSAPQREFIIFELKCSRREGPAKIDEFLETGTMERIAELEKEMGGSE